MKLSNSMFPSAIYALGGIAFSAATFGQQTAMNPQGAEAYRHPLLLEPGQHTIEQYFDEYPQATAEDFLRDHMIVTGVRVTQEGGPENDLTNVTRIVRQPITDHNPSIQPNPPSLSIGPVVQAWIEGEENRPTGSVQLSLGILPGWNPVVLVHHAQRIAMVEGRLRTKADVESVRAATLQQRRQAGIIALSPLRDAILAMGGKIIELVPGAGTLKVELPVAELDNLLKYPDLGRIEVTQEVEDDEAGVAYPVDGDTIDGRELEDLLQTTQAYDRGYEGSTQESIVLVEGGGDDVFNSHFGLAGRFENCVDIGTGLCDFQDPDPGVAHSTAVASVLIGDVTEGQDFVLTQISANPDLAERERSGIVRKGRARGFASGQFSFLEDQMALEGDNYILTQSASSDNDPECRGETTMSRNWNSLFESGYASFNSTGNDGHADPHDCTVSAPATAIGVFSVGAYVINDDDNEVIYSQSDQGGDGSEQEGRQRTVVDIIGPSKMEYAYPHYQWPVDGSGNEFKYGTEWNTGSGNGPSSFCCTSSSTPAVAGTAALFRQWFKDVYNDSVDDPGILYTNLLLMGDRRQSDNPENLIFKNAGFDGLWGAGKLRLRLFDATGLDDPMTWATGSLCIDDGFDTYIDIGSVSSDVDIINAVIWWYDRRHDDGIDHDNIDLDLEYDDGSGYITVVSSHTEDNKERVALGLPAGGTYRINISGQHVTADDEGCGTDSMYVYWAYVAEDSDREADENLDDVRPYPRNIPSIFDWNGIPVILP